ncbi:hypothetical protein [Microbacterium sp.]|uniref:hypothetical protein n=1 Tax=Microbacterium sp. TaxID=51671 RepID=UPI002E362444|nr:hypothetical protein [Microbacterium sp.]HEX5727870.1 hypothetical protein [Microbacterium sp.]
MSAHMDSAFRVAIIGAGMIGAAHRDAARAAGLPTFADGLRSAKIIDTVLK